MQGLLASSLDQAVPPAMPTSDQPSQSANGQPPEPEILTPVTHPCSYCGRTIPRLATYCGFCGKSQDGQSTSGTQKSESTEQQTSVRLVGDTFWLLVGAIFCALWLFTISAWIVARVWIESELNRLR